MYQTAHTYTQYTPTYTEFPLSKFVALRRVREVKSAENTTLVRKYVIASKKFDCYMFMY